MAYTKKKKTPKKSTPKKRKAKSIGKRKTKKKGVYAGSMY